MAMPRSAESTSVTGLFHQASQEHLAQNGDWRPRLILGHVIARRHYQHELQFRKNEQALPAETKRAGPFCADRSRLSRQRQLADVPLVAVAPSVIDNSGGAKTGLQPIGGH